MCLNTRKKLKEKKAFIKSLKPERDGYIWLWKVFGCWSNGELTGQFKRYDFYEGLNVAKGTVIRDLYGDEDYTQYTPGFHCFTTKGAAIWWMNNSNTRRALGVERIIAPVKVRKSWITDVGVQSNRTAVVCKKMIF